MDGFIGGYGWRLVNGLACAERMPIKCLTSSLFGVSSALARRLFGVSRAFTRPFNIIRTLSANNPGENNKLTMSNITFLFHKVSAKIYLGINAYGIMECWKNGRIQQFNSQQIKALMLRKKVKGKSPIERLNC